MNGTLEHTEFRGTPNACSSTDAPPFYWLISLSLGVAAIAGNGLVILANVMKKVKRNPTNCIITNLASVDFLSGVSLILFHTLPTLSKPAGRGVGAQLFCRLYCSDYPLWALLNSSIFNLLLVTVDRYLCVIRPFCHKDVFGRRSVLTTCIIMTWLLGMISCSYIILSWVVSSDRDDMCVVDFSLPPWFFLWGGFWSLFGMLLLPTLLMLIAYAHISYTLSRMPPHSKGRRLQKRVTVSCFAVLSVFFICWLPDQMFFFLFSLNLPSLPQLSLGSWTYHLVLNLGYANSCLNPLLYAFFNPNYRRVFKSMLGRGTVAVSTGRVN
ncbi:mu-type opioid receptor-like [Symsagittifera roscoffensis]|uniref:mu-type opioid receptor-like n=1 Tax=Symsagittifera roscoffensis TaxID=84072 RepID=UPI00307B6AE3